MFANIRPAAALLAASLTVAGLAGTARAAPIDENARSVAVRVADLDLASAGGTAALDARIRYAVTRVCGTADGRDLAIRSQIAACRRAALNDAAPQMEVAIASARSADRLALNGAPSIRVAAH